MAIDIDKILGKPADILVDGRLQAVRDLATGDVLRLSSLRGDKLDTHDQAISLLEKLRAIIGSFFVARPSHLAEWSELKLKAVAEAILAEWKDRAEKNSKSISAAIAAEIANPSATPGNSMQL